MPAFSVAVSHNTITPFLRQVLANAQDTQGILRSMGNALLSITLGNFNSVGAGMRPMPWAAKRDGTPSNLQLTTALAHSWRLNVSSSQAVTSSDRPYAAIHQFGGTPGMKRNANMPARPQFPITKDGRLTPAAAELALRAGQRALLRQTAAKT